jgi:hypothetical protein
MTIQKTADPSNPWSFDNFAISPSAPRGAPKAHPGIPDVPSVPGAPRGPVPTRPRNPVPRIDMVWDCHGNIVRALKALSALDHNDEIVNDPDFRKLRHSLRQGYKQINEYLEIYG